MVGVKTTSIAQFEPHTTSMTLLHLFKQALHDLPLAEITTTAYAKYNNISNTSLNGQVKLLKTLSSLLDMEFTLRMVFIPGTAFLKGVVGVELLLTPTLSLYRLFFITMLSIVVRLSLSGSLMSLKTFILFLTPQKSTMVNCYCTFHFHTSLAASWNYPTEPK